LTPDQQNTITMTAQTALVTTAAVAIAMMAMGGGQLLSFYQVAIFALIITASLK
jgi:hypothetical protein